MAVTKIHRISKSVLIITLLVSAVVVVLFYLGGQVPAQEKIVADADQPKYTDLLLYWAYILLAITVVVLLAFAIVGFIKQLKESPKKALEGFFALLALAVLFLVTYTMGDGTPLNIPGYDGSDNVPGKLKLADMCLYSCYVLLTVTVLAIIIMPLFKKKK